MGLADAVATGAAPETCCRYPRADARQIAPTRCAAQSPGARRSPRALVRGASCARTGLRPTWTPRRPLGRGRPDFSHDPSQAQSKWNTDECSDVTATGFAPVDAEKPPRHRGPGPAQEPGPSHPRPDRGAGAYPFTRGIFADGYRGRLWTIRQYSGFGSAEESNERYRFLLEQGQTGLSVALDLPTQCGYDPIDPMARPGDRQSGRVAVDLAETEIAVRRASTSATISTSFTINGTAAIIYAMYLAVADKQGVPRAKLTGTIQNDILKEYVARGTWIFPVRPSMRLIADSILYSNEASPRFNAISIAGAHVRDAGCTAVEEMAYTLANGLAYVDELQPPRRRRRASSRKRLSFFFYVHMDLFEEVAQVPRRPPAVGAAA